MEQDLDLYCCEVIRQYDDALNIIQGRFEAGKDEAMQAIAEELRNHLRKEMRALRISFKWEMREVRKSEMQHDFRLLRMSVLKRYFERSVDLKSKYFQRHLQELVCGT